MPRIEKMFNLEVSVQAFVRNCSDVELNELFIAADDEVERRRRRRITTESLLTHNDSQRITTCNNV